MFEVTGDDIASLNDADFRTLVGRLCEARLRHLGLSTSAVTYGGDQNAKDGGIDVWVSLPANTAIEGFIARSTTGFQTKATDMGAEAIRHEMRPNGEIRPLIRELAEKSGAYVIASSLGSVSKTSLARRIKAMKEAVVDLENSDRLELDFFDRTRIATWVRDHPGLIPWVREKIGRSLLGWQSYETWAHTPENHSAEYLQDDSARIKTGLQDDGLGLSALAGINRIRSFLNQPRKSVRLTGLSGVGKTRLAQALFDDRLGNESIDPLLAIYTDISDSPNPQPTTLTSDLVTSGMRAIVIVDNCTPALHRRLTDICRRSNSRVSVFTIEYDIREDDAEGTNVFVLERASVGLVEKLLQSRFSSLSQVDARTAAAFSDGNAKIAISLADTVLKKGSLAGLSDTELFERLFFQRHPHDANLMTDAQACSLLYSFNGEIAADQDGELSRLGRLVGRTALDIFRSVAELQARGLAQTRGDWRAILPQAIADRLAVKALETIPYSLIKREFFADPTARLVKSFSRRLSFLHKCPHAVGIVTEWLSSKGFLGDVASLTGPQRLVFENVAPAAPNESLSAIERAISKHASPDGVVFDSSLPRIIRSIAYEPLYFARCITALVAIFKLSIDDRRRDEVERLIESLFFIYLSGTRASIEQRLGVIEILIASTDEREQHLGFLTLSAALEAWHFTSHYSFEFGAQPRDYGFGQRTTKTSCIGTRAL